MIYGIGIDIVKIGRIQQAVERWGEHFLEKIYTGPEVEYCFSKKVPFLSLAVRFAAKEAFIKAVGSEVRVPLKEIEVLTADDGKPRLRAYGNTETFLRERKIRSIHLSMSHEQEFGIASVVLETGGGQDVHER